jgi:hypothetical protein
MKVRVSTRQQSTDAWQGATVQLACVPAVGEYVCRDGKADLYRVTVVVHTLDSADIDAEIWAERAGNPEELASPPPLGERLYGNRA